MICFPSDWAWHNYVDVWSQIPLAQYLFATLIYAFTAALGSVVLGTLAAYALSRLEFHGKQLLLYSLLVSQVIR